MSYFSEKESILETEEHFGQHSGDEEILAWHGTTKRETPWPSQTTQIKYVH
jgi:hypothetical protein